ncbi:ABC transporter permease [Erythrobacter sp.]|uniref:ABC transporter permease n=1 Tax=Erythrobacter sp. TaxID=1042 RepID=UPI0025E56195|nr:ABC transporter permease [Erythrobacter sp.]
MSVLLQSWAIQVRVIKALMLRELSTRFGRENIGFLWVMAEPLLFAVLVGILWRSMKGPFEFGVDIIAFVVTGYIPLVLFRSSLSRAMNSFTANGSLMYHRQIKVLDLLLVRFLIELVGHMMAYLFIAVVLGALGNFPWPYDFGFLLLGWAYYSLFSFAVCLVVAPLSEASEVLEKFLPVTAYLMVPFSGAFFVVSSLSPEAAAIVLYSPPVHGMEMMRYGVFGPSIDPQYDYLYPLQFSLPCMVLGLLLCRTIRRRLVIE